MTDYKDKLIMEENPTFERIEDKNLKNQPCYDKNGNFLGWFSPSIAVVSFVFCKNKNDKWCILAAQRGKGTPDPEFIGAWNCICGYHEFYTKESKYKTVKDSAIREILEETGLHLSTDDLEFEGYDDNDNKRQNVTFHFVGVLVDVEAESFKFSHKYNEKDEVGDIKFIELGDIDKYKWAFGHDKLIRKYASMYNL